MNFYNDNEPFVVGWLINLIEAGMLPPGDVACKSIKEICANDVRRYNQCHFFAGIGGWPLALQLAGWPADRRVWTASCPCQPFSCAGKRKGHGDERHLWPELKRLIAKCRPTTVFGEQVASKDGRQWLSGIRADLEALGYAVAAADLCAAGVGAPHIRQRLYWVANSDMPECGWGSKSEGVQARISNTTDRSKAAWLPNSDITGRQELCREKSYRAKHTAAEGGGMGKSHGNIEGAVYEVYERESIESTRGDFWDDGIPVEFYDGKSRRLKPGLAMLVDGFPGRVGQVRAYGNAIVPHVAAEFIRCFMEL